MRCLNSTQRRRATSDALDGRLLAITAGVSSMGRRVQESMEKIIIWGGTGNLRVLYEMLVDRFHIAGYFDNNANVAKDYRGIPLLGNRKAFLEWVSGLAGADKPNFIVGIGPGHGNDRLAIHDELKAHGLRPITAIHRTAFVAETAQVGEGSQVYANAAVCADVRIGRACIVNTSASIDHECVIEHGATVGPGAILAGLVKVGANADIYAGATILPRIRVGTGAAVGAGAVVLEDVPDHAVVVGNPARVIKVREG